MGAKKQAASNSRGVSGVVQFHTWRAFDFERQLFHCVFVAGFVTILLSRKPLLDRLVLMLAEYEKMRLEEAARGVSPKYPNAGKVMHVPAGRK